MINKIKNLKIKLSSFTTKDKLDHMFYGTLIYYIISFINIHIAIIVTLFVAVLIEYSDSKGSGEKDFKDILFTIFLASLFHLKELLSTLWYNFIAGNELLIFGLDLLLYSI